jgi:hypothetical protein
MQLALCGGIGYFYTPGGCMVFVDSSSASQAARDASESQQQMLEALALILAALMEQLKQKREGKEEAEGGEKEEPLNEEQVNTLCAQSVESLLEQYGQEHQLENGDSVRMFAAEGFTISTDALDLTGFPVYTLSTPKQGDVLSFQRNPNGEGYIFFETQSTLELEQKIELLQSLQSITQQQWMPEFETPIDQVKWQQENLGPFAPKGTQAILVAHELLKGQTQEEVTVTGNSYQIQRTKEAIAIYSTDPAQADKPLYRLENKPGAQIESNADAIQQDQFHQMWKTFEQAKQAELTQQTSTAQLSQQKGAIRPGTVKATPSRTMTAGLER